MVAVGSTGSAKSVNAIQDQKMVKILDEKTAESVGACIKKAINQNSKELPTKEIVTGKLDNTNSTTSIIT